MIVYDEKQLLEILEMYVPSAIYLTHVELYSSKADDSSPDIIAHLHIPPKPVYLVENVDIRHVNNTDAAFIINQTVFCLYRWALINGMLGMPQMSVEMLRSLYDKMFIKRELRLYEKFTPRFTVEYENGEPVRKPRTDLVVRLWHVKSRQVGTAMMVWNRLEILDFLIAETVGGVDLKN